MSTTPGGGAQTVFMFMKLANDSLVHEIIDLLHMNENGRLLVDLLVLEADRLLVDLYWC